MRNALGLRQKRIEKQRLRNCIQALAALVFFASIPAAHSQIITQLFSFPCPPQQVSFCKFGYAPNAILQASDGNFYGAAQLSTQGTSEPHGGSLFRITPAGRFTLLFTFAEDSGGKYLNGDNPASGLLEANDGFLYGTAIMGGATNNGVLFRIGKGGKGFSVVHSFCSSANCADGNSPASLVLGHDGNLYGVTIGGGSNAGICQSIGGCGTIFRFSAATGFTTIFEFDGSGNGMTPQSLTQDGNDNFFYGTAGAEVFRFAPSGEFKTLTVIPRMNGILPTSSDSGLIQSSNGKLYGGLLTYSVEQAQLFEINPSGGGFHEFQSMGKLASDFRISTPIQASDGNLWTAFTLSGTASGQVFAISPGSGGVMQSFEFDGVNGSNPEAGVLQAADGKLYGTSRAGGIVGGGQVASGTVWVLDAGLAPPAASVAAFVPASGVNGARVLIRGDHFIGTTTVTFHGANAIFKVLNRNFISAVVPPGATSGAIAVTNAAGISVSSESFTVLAH